MKSRATEAYKRLVESGELTDRQLDVYQVMFTHRGMYRDGMTAREVNAWMATELTKHSGVHSRLRELAKIGLVYRDGAKRCSVSKRTVNRWRLECQRATSEGQQRADPQPSKTTG